MNNERFAEVFRQFEQRLNEAEWWLTSHFFRISSARSSSMVGSSRRRSLHAYQEFARTSSWQMQDFLHRNRNWRY